MSMQSVERVPMKGWVTTIAGTTINLCLGILYAWSIWKKALVNVDLAGQPMTGLNAGWTYLTNAQAATPFSICVILFALLMIPGGRLQDKFGPKIGATAGGLFLAGGCILAGLMKSQLGLILGFGILGGIGMGLGYAAPTPAALKWFGPSKRGLISGLVVAGYGGAAIYIGGLGQFFIDRYGISGSFIGLGLLFAVVCILGGQLLFTPPPGYTPPASQTAIVGANANVTRHDWTPGEIFRSWQFYALIVLFMISTQSGLLIIANAAGLLNKAAGDVPFLMANAWILVSFGGVVNAAGRVGTGFYSDKIGRVNAYCLNCVLSAACMFLLPYVIAGQNVLLLFLVVGIAYWQYGGGLALMPSFTADFYGSKYLGFNYGLVFMGWGMGFFMPSLGGTIEDITGSLRWAFYMSAGLLIVGVILALMIRRPKYDKSGADASASAPGLSAE
ncbi:MFS transporter [Desulfosarcina sp. OttesenSCG-928-A07]|nr:MFS transporter [Desulfosarcina sp. OttesenSCG-928-G17]MDL2330094.1 MFS transporter [Desulfosarcina sp. OttesenSCG-928-A07]